MLWSLAVDRKSYSSVSAKHCKAIFIYILVMLFLAQNRLKEKTQKNTNQR